MPVKRTPDLDSLYCINDDGSRRTIHVADVKGRFQVRKKLIWAALVGLYVVLPAEDGYVRIVLGNPKHFAAFRALVGEPEELQGPEWDTHIHRAMNADLMRIFATERFAERTRDELFDEAARLGCPLGAIREPHEFVAHPQTRARDAFVATGFSHLGDAPFIRPAIQLSRTPTSLSPTTATSWSLKLKAVWRTSLRRRSPTISTPSRPLTLGKAAMMA